MGFAHPCPVRAEGEVVKFPAERVEARARFDTFFEEERERLFRSLYFVTGNRDDAEELTQEAFLRLWGSTCMWRETSLVRSGRRTADC